MKNLAVPVVAALALAVAVPSFAGGSSCSGSAAMCSGGASTTAWSGACLQRSASGAVTVAEVAAGSPAARAGLRAGDVVTAVNGRALSGKADGAMCEASCPASASCTVGSKLTYTVRRGAETKTVAVQLAKLPADVAHRWAKKNAGFDASVAALVMPASAK